MLSVKAITQNQNIRYYFEKDNNYYFKADQEHLIAAFEWQGKGAQLFGLEGQVTLADFERVMGGITPDGEQLGLKKGDAFLRRPGFDLTFSAPKSVSILALIGGDDRLLALHQKAVTIALEVVEREAQARITVKGNTSYHPTRNLIMAKFIHDTSRAGDPALHSHAVISNMTYCEDLKWRSLASDLSRENGFFERVMDDHTYYGMIYRSVMAKGVTEFGYEIEIVNKYGMFEIKGMPERVLKAYSKRRNQIEAAAEEMGHHSFKAYDMATLNTREPKKQVDRQTLINEWLSEMDELGWDMVTFMKEADERANSLNFSAKDDEAPHPEKKEKTRKGYFHFLEKRKEKKKILAIAALSKQVVTDAIAALSQGTLCIDYTTVIKRAAEYGLGKCTYPDLVKAFDALVDEKVIIPLDKKGILFATMAQVKTEVSLMEAVATSKKAYCAIRAKEGLLQKQDLSNADQQVIKNLLICQDSIVQLNHASDDKHAFLSMLLNTVEDHGKSVKILLPNAMHANDSKENIARSSASLWQWLKKLSKDPVKDSIDTVAGFCFKREKNIGSSFKKGVIIVDGAQKLSPQVLKELFEVTKKSKVKIILLNETEGIHYTHQSSAMKTLQKANIKTLVYSGASSKPPITIQLKSIVEDEERLKALAADYAQLPDHKRLNTLVVGQSMREARFLTQEIRRCLKNSGQLGRAEKTVVTHQPVFLTATERQYAQHYTKEMVIRTYKDYAYHEQKIIAVIPEENTLIVINEKGKKERLSCKKMPKEGQIFEEKKLVLSTAEKVLVTGNMKKLGLLKGEVWQVKKIGWFSITLEKDKKHVVKIAKSDLNKMHIDYHYAESLSQLREQKVGTVMTSLKSRAVNKENMHVLSRKSDNLVIYTNDVEKAESRFNVIPDRTTVIEKIVEAHQGQALKNILTDDNIGKWKDELNDTIKNLNITLENPVHEAIDFAIAKLSERNAGFEHKELMETAILYAMGKVTPKELEANLREKIASGILVNGRDEKGHTIWTTQEAVTMEQEILAGLKKGKNTQKPLMEKDSLMQKLEDSPLTPGQKDACYLIGTTQDRFVMIQGYAGTGKSTTLGKLAQLLAEMKLENNGQPIKILACAPTHQAVKELASLGIEAQTIKSLLIEHAQLSQDFSNTLLLLDEDSMEGNQDIHRFQTMVEQCQGRAVYVGDKDQFLSVESGKPKENALNSGAIDVAYMKDIVRQDNADIKEAVLDIIHEDVTGALEKIEQLNPHSVPREENSYNEEWLSIINGFEKSVISAGVPRRDENGDIIEADQDKSWEIAMPLANAVAQEYLSRTKEVRDDTVIIVQTHKDRALVHDAIIEGLMARGEIEKTGFETNRLVSKGLTKVEARHVLSYQIGDYIKIGKGDYLQISLVVKDTKTLECLRQDGTKEVVFPHKISDKVPVEVYRKKEDLLSKGMRIKITKTDKERNLLANKEWFVVSALDGNVQLKEKESERMISLNTTDLKDAHWDYAYTSTGYGIQGSSCGYVIDLAASYLKHLTNRRAFYISVSRAKKHVMMFVDNKKALLEKFLDRGDKYAALEVTGEIKKASSKVKNTPRNNAIQTQIPMQNHEENPEYPYDGSLIDADYSDWASLQESTTDVMLPTENAVTDTQKSLEKTPVVLPKKEFFDAKSVEIKLRDKAEMVLGNVLGERNRSSTHKAWKYGSNNKQGSLTVTMNGDKKGLWYDFDTQEGGGMLKLIEKQLGLSFKEALEYGAYLVGESPSTEYQKMSIIPTSFKEKTAIKKENKTLETALKLIKESREIAGTLAENYLKNTRKIEQVPNKNLRFLPQAYTGSINNEVKKYAPALLSIARDNEGKVQGVQVTYLDQKTINKADLPIKKRTYGRLDGACVSLQKGKDYNEVTYLAEGAETGLSVANAKPDSRVLVTLGKANFSNVDPNSLTKKVVFCLDNDGYHTFTNSLSNAAEKLTAEGKEVSFVMAETTKTDLNDLLKTGGLMAVNEVLKKEITVDNFKEMTEISQTFIAKERAIKQAEKLSKNSVDETTITIDAFRKNAEIDFIKRTKSYYSSKNTENTITKKLINLNNKDLSVKAVQSIASQQKNELITLNNQLYSSEKNKQLESQNLINKSLKLEEIER